MEYRAFWASGEASFNKENLYYEVSGTKVKVLSALLVIQLLWGLSFIKEACKYCMM